jgi:hypothetical protein
MMSGADATPVKTFISYSWSSPTHDTWVIELATRLRQDGVDAILDKWDLKPGHDAYKFMEQMVTDPRVTKVIMICNRKYAEKADQRSGGVGTESQIISPELYGKGSQDKFAAVLIEHDENGNAAVPVFYKGRIYFDFTSDDRHEAVYEELLRWILGRPARVKPVLGPVPEHIVDQDAPAPVSNSRFRRADDAIRRNAPTAPGLIRDYREALKADLEQIRIFRAGTIEADDAVIARIEQTRPLVNRVTDLTSSIARYDASTRTFDEVLSLLEMMGEFMYRPEHIRSWSETDFDNFKFSAHEAFLASFSVLLRERRFDLATQMVGQTFILRQHDSAVGGTVQGYTAFRNYLRSLEKRNQRLALNRASLHADLLKAAYENHNPSFADLMQADFVLYLRDAIASDKGDIYPSWYPISLIYTADRGVPFDIFARSESAKFLDRILPVLGTSTGAELKERVAALANSEGVPRWHFHRLAVVRLANAENLGVRP